MTPEEKQAGQSNEKSIPTAIEKYINDMVTLYVEPQRAGTPKGDPIGMSLKKYHASLLVALLVDRGLKEIADQFGDEIGFSYGVLRKWSIQLDFKKAIAEHRLDFQKYDDIFRVESLAEILKKKHTLEMCIKISNNVIENNYSKDELDEIWEHLNQIV